MSVPYPRPRRVLVVGGGPCGLVTLRNLLQHGDLDQVELVERRDDVGGVWYLDSPPSTPSPLPRWPSPAYPGLVGNVLPEFLSFSGAPFPPPAHTYPTLAETHAYLQAFAAPLRAHIRLNTEVRVVEQLVEGGWRVVLRDWNQEGEEEREERWDAVVLATAWYDHPIWPATPGLAELRAAGLAIHAKEWRGPQAYARKRVLVIGSGNSSNDIAAQLATTAHTPLHRSIRHPTNHRFVFLPDERITDAAPVASYALFASTAKPTATAHLTDGTALADLDAVLIGTGYATHVPFLRVLDPAFNLVPLTGPTVSPPRIPHLHRHILYTPCPTLAFSGAVVSATPFILADLGSAWLALAWSGSLPAPAFTPDEPARLEELAAASARAEWESALTAFHVLGDGELEYARALWAEAVAARGALRGVLPEWDEELWTRREAMYAVKYRALSEAREEGRGVGNLVRG